MKVICLLAFSWMLFVACSKEPPRGINKFADSTIVRIADLQDRRQSDSLYEYLHHPLAVYRREAALALASVQDTLAAGSLGQLLNNDEEPAVKKAAAFALGQTKCRLSEKILESAYNNEKRSDILGEIAEAYGKVTNKWSLQQRATDSVAVAGFAWGIYRAGLNGLGDSILNSAAAAMLAPGFNELTRLGAAHYFARSAKNLERFQKILIHTALTDPAENVRMSATLSLRKVATDSVFAALGMILKNDSSVRVRINATRALQGFPIEKMRSMLLDAIGDRSPSVGIAASEALVTFSTTAFWRELLPMARSATNWRIKGNLYNAALAGSDTKEVADEIRLAYMQAQDPYHKAALLTALGRSLMLYGFILDQLEKTDHPVIRSAAASAIVAMNYSSNFKPFLRKDFADAYAGAIRRADPAVVGIMSAALADPSLHYNQVITDTSFLFDARKRLTLPKDNEALQSLEAAMAYFEGKEAVSSVSNEFNHPVDWKLVKQIPSGQLVSIITTKGVVTIKLLVDEAPGSVANFVSLAGRQYFDGKFFHRVVPNFVAQGGCNRGDGYGSEDYSIRSEFSERRYATGSVGMASAGKDTECAQWFITHSPTPHLDGRYTIFAVVTSGMDVVQQLEVGDKIVKIDMNK